MIDRRSFLELLGLTTVAGLTAEMVEALGDAQGIPVPGALLDTLPRPLVIPVVAPTIVAPSQELGFTGLKFKGARVVDLDELNRFVIEKIMPGIVGNFFQDSPLESYLACSGPFRYWGPKVI